MNLQPVDLSLFVFSKYSSRINRFTKQTSACNSHAPACVAFGTFFQPGNGDGFITIKETPDF